MACGLPFLFYLRTMAPTVYGLDSAELTTGAYVLGIVHAPGSPLYLLLGHAFSWLPFGDVGYRLNVMSGCTAALAALFVYFVLSGLTRRRGLALGGAWYLAFTYYFWVSAVAAELYALQACFVAGLLALALKWRRSGRPLHLCLLALLFGLGMGNHLSLVLLAPGFAVLALTAEAEPWKRPRLLLTAATCGVVGLSVYLYLPLRFLSDAPLNYARDYWNVDLASWRGFWWMLTGRMFGQLFFAVPLSDTPHEVFLYLQRLWSNFTGLGVLLGIVGFVGDCRCRPALQVSLLLMVVGHLIFFLTYGAGDKELMFLPTYVIWGVWAALGAGLIDEYLRRRTSNRWAFSAPSLLILMAVGNIGLNFDYVDVSHDTSARVRGANILAELEPHAVYFGTWADVPIVEYLQIVERQRPDVVTINLFFAGADAAARLAEERLGAGRPVYTSAPELLGEDLFEFHCAGTCDCYRVMSDRCRSRVAVAESRADAGRRTPAVAGEEHSCAIAGCQ